MAFYLGFFTGALLSTFLIRALFIFIFQKIDKSKNALRSIYIFSNILSWVCSGTLAIFGLRDDKDLTLARVIQPYLVYLLPQIIWLVYDLNRLKKSEKETTKKKSPHKGKK
jgi:hypothetical protein